MDECGCVDIVFGVIGCVFVELCDVGVSGEYVVGFGEDEYVRFFFE